MFSSLDKFPLLAVPFFILAGKLMEGRHLVLVGSPARWWAASRAARAQLRAHLPIFAAVSGSSVATTFAVSSSSSRPSAHGLSTNWAASLQATSAELGVIVPPSVPMILYGVAAEVSIGEMFVAGIGPGVLIAGALMLYVLIWARVTGMGKRDGEGRLALWVAGRNAFWALMMPVIILGIHSVFAPGLGGGRGRRSGLLISRGGTGARCRYNASVDDPASVIMFIIMSGLDIYLFT